MTRSNIFTVGYFYHTSPPFQVLTAINHAQLWLNRTFSDEEIKSGVLADLMIDEDFDFETTVSLLFYRLESVMYQTLLNDEPEFVPSLHYIFSYYVPFSPKI